ncbi:two pore domain potassium channel family protein [Candidatus Woesearchaeota archaeon]|nr:two pore domain potassium channel family protein [Candidatus Woesearchaeota archaeon]
MNFKLETWLDKLSFLNILTLWIIIISGFGLIYHFFSNDSSFLLSTQTEEVITKLSTDIYFSFITATTTGFGDIIPLGFFRIIAIIQVILGLLLLALVTSKLVSIKQEVIVSEIYEISFNERISRIRSSLLLFRQNLARVFERLENKTIKQHDIEEVQSHITLFEDTLNNIHTTISKSNKSRYTRKIDTLNSEIILNSIINSFDKLKELNILLNQNKLELNKFSINKIESCMNITDNIFNKIPELDVLPESFIEDLKFNKRLLFNQIKDLIKK